MKKAFFFLPVLLLAISCDKNDNNDTSAAKTKTQIITQSAWKFETVGIDADKNGTMDTDLSSQVDACIKDNTLKFEANGSGTADEGATKCSNTTGQTTPFTWAFASNETTINISGSAVLGYGGQYKIVTLTDTKMSLSKDTTLGFLGTQTLIANFTH